MRIEPAYLPTPSEIIIACSRIRERWSPAERRRRLVGLPSETIESRWQPPTIDMSMCAQRIRKEVTELTA